ncbi:hypothetical protein D3C76_1874750 [compost metagenome]
MIVPMAPSTVKMMLRMRPHLASWLSKPASRDFFLAMALTTMPAIAKTNARTKPTMPSVLPGSSTGAP